MKKTLIILFALALAASAAAQTKDTTYWTRKGVAVVNMSQVSLTNWSAGGDNSVAFDLGLVYTADYARDKNLWQNRLELAYGLNNTSSNGTRKTNDKIFLSSAYGYKFAPEWYFSLMLTFQSQFAEGYDYSVSDSDYISNFMAPGYLTIGPGIAWTPNKWFKATLSPASWRGTFVLDDKLSDQGAFGVDKGKHLRSEFGANLILEANKEVMKNITLYSRLSLFSNYLEKPQNVDVYWDTQINMKINKWFSTNLTCSLIYDDDTKIPTESGRSVAKIQFKEVLGVGLTAQF